MLISPLLYQQYQLIILGQPNQDVANYGFFFLTTSAAFYSGSKVTTTEEKEVTNYVLMDLSKKIIPKKESVTVLDGTLLLCDSSGKPVGLPKGSEVTSKITSSLADEEIDSRMGFIFVKNKLETNEGMIFGFYDLKEKEFLGNKIAFVDVLSRGINNVYIAISAIDADGNSQNSIDYIGPKVSTTFIPADVPIKRICPVYSVAFQASSAIQIGDLQSYIDKKEAWPLPITPGSFGKSIQLKGNMIFDDWKSNYLNNTLFATYDTSSGIAANWSDIFGKGFYDIKNEKPIIISDKQIQIRQAPFLVWPEPSNYPPSQIKIFKPQLNIYTRASKNNEWVEVPFSKIRDYNANTGMIEFTERLVPSNESLIKVNYVRKSSDLILYNINGNPIPLNPFLNSQEIELNKGLYVYTMPLKIDKQSSLSGGFTLVPVTEYQNESVINYTYDSKIFDSSSIKYNPFALLIGIVYFINNPKRKKTNLSDTRLRGGGLKSNIELLEIQEVHKDAIHNWDMYPVHGTSYPRGGFVIIKIPEEVKNNFNSVLEIYEIIRSNLTAGVSFEIQNLEGEPWEI